MTNNLIDKAQSGCPDALEKIITEYKYHYFLKKYYFPGFDEDDILQEIRIALLHSIHTFRKSKGASFTTFATLCIHNHLKTLLRKNFKKSNIPTNLFNFNSDSFMIEDINFETPESIYLFKEYNENIEKKLFSIFNNFEKEIYYLIKNGHTYKEVSILLDISPKSSDNAIQRVKRKFKKIIQSTL